MSTDLEKEMKEIQLEEVEQDKKEENPNPSKIAKGKKIYINKQRNEILSKKSSMSLLTFVMS